MAETDLHDTRPESAVRGVCGLPARWYWERDIWQAERRRIFAREWQLAAPASDLPNALQAFGAPFAGCCACC